MDNKYNDKEEKYVEEPVRESRNEYVEEPMRESRNEYAEEPIRESRNEYIEEPVRESRNECVEEPIRESRTINNGYGEYQGYRQEYRQEPNFILKEKIQQRMDEKERKKGARKKKMRKFVSVACIALLFGGISGGTFLGVTYVGGRALNLDEMKQEAPITNTMVSSTESINVLSDVTEIANVAMPCIVSITNLSVQEVMSFFGQSATQEVQSAGSGIIIGENDTELLILSNNHVVENSNTLTVTFSNETSLEAIVKGTDPEKDLAVIAVRKEDIDAETKESMKIATLGDSEELQVGEPVIAIGNALGYGQSVTTGIVSAKDRLLDGIDADLIQTDAAINPGNSGGALLNAQGEVIGINTAKVKNDAVEGMGYAIPISDASETINALINLVSREKVAEEDRGYIGIQGLTVTEEGGQIYNMPKGVYIAEVTEGGAANEAGIFKGSIITAVDEVEVSTIDALLDVLSYYKYGTEVTLTVEIPTQAGDYETTEVILTLQKATE